ncbi:hypothetical protein CANTEDRAFT_112654 [Yamadazyma tenuis ATCC 10573]|uniref:INSIG-domain-containing protein n=1 Tax=Candida tenuis (strain ATCC 10573 / BCRC 21748 / CBS 615 / JCM 9827 / NBRC 10315 / NRRL Y-1498 / VKM Y-70) TaxID=590646 RepID=G3AY76_CANTC|nr:uncharacterized protein CANTEDRAFT_112654 [Yamadazyma tenuis ATCC 10573]XP_006684755.1 uncharacterized protein CANTEDRAFT_112654 [Yamadazyma tenuis ATCC 10573]EGV66180.1 hypothetical protein CANTEDRAFT_112654 [Yamadazyma tenuis ATCC 10573]EGV66181.1 hypothetical protein CANTEDRAFT_112654 [Yamadazyma tenuis ATCC 10573]
MSSNPIQLKKSILSNGTLKDVPDSRLSTRASSPIEKTDSVINLTKPSLYSIYNENAATALNLDDDEDDSSNQLYVQSTRVEEVYVPDHLSKGSKPVVAIKFILKAAVLSVCAYTYNEITRHIRNNHIKLGAQTFQPLFLTELFLTKSFHAVEPLKVLSKNFTPSQNYATVLVFQGMIMGLVHPFLDFVIPPKHNRRLFSSNPDPKKRYEPATLFNDILRSLITFLGISYAIRNLEWSSSLQVSVVWSLLSPCLWLLLDGTVAGLLAGLVVTVWGCLFVYSMNSDLINIYTSFESSDFIAIWLWTSSFFFCGMIIFGKIGRALF